MDLPVPFNLVMKAASWIWQRVTRVLLYKTYVESHKKWNSRHRLGARWKQLGDHLEYSVRIAQPTDHKPHVSQLALRSTGQRLSKVDLYFEARGAGVRYQDKVSVCDVDQTPMVWNLMNVPVLKFLETSGEGIAFSVEEIQLRHCVVRLANGDVLPPHESLRASLTQSWLISDEWARQWGHWWNCNAIKFAKGELSLYWRFCFGLPRNRVYSPHASGPFCKPFVQSLIRSVGRLMALPPLVTAQFWMAIWSGLCVIDEDDKLSLRWRVGKKRDADPF